MNLEVRETLCKPAIAQIQKLAHFARHSDEVFL